MKTIYIIRHGKPLYKLKCYLGQKNPSLSNLGLKQANYLKDYFSCMKIDKIYTSDLTRAMQTAKIISNQNNTKIEYVTKIREINLGKWDGMPFKIIRKKYPISFYIRGINLEHYKPPCGESFSDLKIRVIPAFNKIVEETKHQSVIVSHAGVNRIIIADILEIPIAEIFKIKQDYGAINKIIIKQNNEKIVSVSPNFCPFSKI